MALSGTEIAGLVTAVAALVGAVFGGAKLLGSGGTSVVHPPPDFSPLIERYDELVNTLREEVGRIRKENDALRGRVVHLEEVEDELEAKIAECEKWINEHR